MAKNWRRRLWTAPYYWLYELHMFWFMPAFVESDFFAGVSMVLLMFCFFAKLSHAVEWCHSVFLIFFLSLLKVKTLQNIQQLLPVLCLQQSSVFWTDISWPEPDWDPSLFLFYHFPQKNFVQIFVISKLQRRTICLK